MPMHRPVRIYAMNGEIKKFECPNPECNEILSLSGPQREPTNPVGMKQENIECSCGDTARVRVVNRGAPRI